MSILMLDAVKFRTTGEIFSLLRRFDDCTLPRLVLAPIPGAKFKQHGKKEGQVIRLNHRSTVLK